jgi:hypothetical protein
MNGLAKKKKKKKARIKDIFNWEKMLFFYRRVQIVDSNKKRETERAKN